MKAWSWMLPALAWSLLARADIIDCLPAQPLDLVVRIGDPAPAQRLRLVGGASPPLRLQHPDTGAVLWTASAGAPAAQVFPDLWAGFSGSLAALDLDGDGLHDRLYAGDLAGRMWRFDIHNGAPAASLLTGGIFASLGGTPAVRAFVVAPDVSLSSTAAGALMLNIAVGSASLVPGIGVNRFYVLRDQAPLQIWTQAEYGRWNPIQETQLAWANDPSHTPEDGEIAANEAGLYVTLADSSVVLHSITVSGRAVIALAQQSASSGSCSVAVTVSSISMDTGQSAVDFDGNGVVGRDEQLRLPRPLPAVTDFALVPDAAGTMAGCRLGDTEVPGCSLSTRLVPTWWRREDAD